MENGFTTGSSRWISTSPPRTFGFLTLLRARLILSVPVVCQCSPDLNDLHNPKWQAHGRCGRRSERRSLAVVLADRTANYPSVSLRSTTYSLSVPLLLSLSSTSSLPSVPTPRLSSSLSVVEAVTRCNPVGGKSERVRFQRGGYGSRCDRCGKSKSSRSVPTA